MIQFNFVDIDVGAATIDIAGGDALMYLQLMQEIHIRQGCTSVTQQSTLVVLFHEMLQTGYVKWQLPRAAYRHCYLWRKNWSPGNFPNLARPPPEETTARRSLMSYLYLW